MDAPIPDYLLAEAVREIREGQRGEQRAKRRAELLEEIAEAAREEIAANQAAGERSPFYETCSVSIRCIDAWDRLREALAALDELEGGDGE